VAGGPALAVVDPVGRAVVVPVDRAVVSQVVPVADFPAGLAEDSLEVPADRSSGYLPKAAMQRIAGLRYLVSRLFPHVASHSLPLGELV